MGYILAGLEKSIKDALRVVPFNCSAVDRPCLAIPAEYRF
jgi:hypothetical protein